MSDSLKNHGDSNEEILQTTELFATQGGVDVDMDEDCYVAECIISATFCTSNQTNCYFSV